MMKKKIMVVEDDLLSLSLLEEFLSLSYDVVPAENGNKALEKLKELETQPANAIQAIVLDWIMPGLSGIELLKILKNHAHYRDIPIVMQTAKAESVDIIDGLKLGVFQYLAKPYDDTVLLAMVDAAVREYDRLQEEKNAIREYQKSTRHFFKKQLLDLKILEVLNEFSLESFSPACQTTIDLVQLVVKALKKFEFPSASSKEAALTGEKEILRCSILVKKEKENEIGFSDRGYEEKLCLADRFLLSQAIDQKIILTKNNYTAIPSKSSRVGFLIRNSPTREEERERAVNIITNIIEYFEKRLEYFENQLKIKEQKEILEKSHEQTKEVIQSSLQKFEDVNRKYQNVKEMQMEVWENLIKQIDATSPLRVSVESAMNEALQLYSEDHLTDQRFLEIMIQLGEIFGRKQVSEEAFAQQLGGISQADVDSLLASLQK
jgi:DNA-binding response OmpR family regulator